MNESEKRLRAYFGERLPISQQRNAIELSMFLKHEYGQTMCMDDIEEAEGNAKLPKACIESRVIMLEPSKMVLDRKSYEYIPIEDSFKTKSVADMFIRCYARYKVDPESIIAPYIPRETAMNIRKADIKVMKTCKNRVILSGSSEKTYVVACNFCANTGRTMTKTLMDMGIDILDTTCATCPFYEKGEAIKGEPEMPVLGDFRRAY